MNEAEKHLMAPSEAAYYNNYTANEIYGDACLLGRADIPDLSNATGTLDKYKSLNESPYDQFKNL
jgi:hypothetical protein